MSHRINETEMKKLLKYKGKSLLVLFDFSKKPFSSDDLEVFREHPSVGQGNHKKSPYQISYFFKDINKETGCIKKQIRANKQKKIDLATAPQETCQS